MVKISLVLVVCLVAVLCLESANGCCGGGRRRGGCHGGGRRSCGLFGGRRPCGRFGVRRPCGGFRAPCVRPPCRRPRPCGGRRPCRPQNIFGNIFGGLFHKQNRLPPFQGSLGGFSWRTVYGSRNERYIVFTFNGQTRKYLFTSGGAAQITIFLVRFKKDINYNPAPVRLPAVNGNLGLFSWTTSYNIRNERFLIIVYNGQTKIYAFPSGSTVASFLVRFKKYINYNPIPAKLPAVHGNRGLFRWQSTYGPRNERYVVFYFNNQGKKYSFPSGSTVESFLVRFKKDINYNPIPAKLPAVHGNRGLFRWQSTYGPRNERYVVFYFNNQGKKYSFPSGSTVESFLIRFKNDISYSAPKPETGASGPVTWETNWNNDQGTITFYFRQIVNGKLVVVGQNTYTLSTGSKSEINGFLSNFQSSSVVTNYQAPSPPTNGNYYRYETNFANGQRTITFYFKLYVNGEAVSTITKQYTLTTGSSAEINSFYQKFNTYCAENSHYEPAPKVTGKLTWKTKYVGNDHYVTMYYKEYKNDVLVDTKSKEYKLTSGSDAEIKEKVEDFKKQLKSGNV